MAFQGELYKTQLMDDIFFELKELCDEFGTYHAAVLSEESKSIGEFQTYHALIKDVGVKIRDKYVALKKLVVSNANNLKIVNDLVAFFMDSHIKLLSAIAEHVRLNLTPITATHFESKPRPPKLPDIALPTFDGSLHHWISFRDMFESMVHNQASLTNIQRFHYLTTAFKLPTGLPNILTNFPLSEDSYLSAWSAIKDRYDDKQKLKATHISQMFKVKKMSCDSASEVRRVLDSFSTIHSILQQLKSDNFDDLFCHVTLQKLDDQTIREYQLSLKTTEPDFQDLQDFLTSYWKSIDHVPESKKSSFVSCDNQSQSTSNESLTASSESISCTMCKKNHLLYTCSKFQMKSVQDRKIFVEDNQLCVNCFSPAHLVGHCTSLNRCKTCKGIHHSLLHCEEEASGPSLSMPVTSESSSAAVPSSSASSFPHNHHSMVDSDSSTFVPYATLHHSTHHSTHHSLIHSVGLMKNTELLSTVKVNIIDAKGNPHRCRALLDNGSDSSVISSSLATKLNLPLANVNILITGINGKVNSVQHKTTVTISSHYGPYEKEVLCFVMPSVTGNIPHQIVPADELKIPMNRILADPEFRIPAPVDLLLSISIFYEVLLSDKIHLAEGPMLIHTKLGWILGGTLNHFDSEDIDEESPEIARTVRSSEIADVTLESFDEGKDALIEMLGVNLCPTHNEPSCNFKAISDTSVIETNVLSEFTSGEDSIGLAALDLFKRFCDALITHNVSEFSQFHFSSFRILNRVTAIVNRFVHNVNCKRAGLYHQAEGISIEELDSARFHIIRILQQTLFPLEYKFFFNLRNDVNLHDKLPGTPRLHQIAPFWDTDGLIRTRERTVKSDVLSFNQIVLPEGGFTKLIVRNLHLKHDQSGWKHLLSLFREQFWTLRIETYVNQVAQDCSKCFQFNPELIQQLLKTSPPVQVTRFKPSSSRALDHFNHFLVKSGLVRNSSSIETYIAEHKRISTRAIYLELVTSPSCSSFEATYNRFVAHRGNVVKLIPTTQQTLKESSTNLR